MSSYLEIEVSTWRLGIVFYMRASKNSQIDCVVARGMNDIEYLRTKNLDGYILKLVHEINKAYDAGLFISVEVLSRKLIENLVIDLLLKNPGPSSVWRDSKANIKNNLTTLLRSFWELIDDEFKKYCANYSTSKIEEMRNTSWEIKKLGDEKIHTVSVTSTQDDLLERQTRFQDLIDFMLKIYKGIPHEHKKEEEAKSTSMDGESNKLDEIAQLVDDDWILLRRSFPNQYPFALAFFYLYSDSPKSTREFSNWLDLNGITVSNPSHLLRRLADDDALAVIKNSDGYLRYFLTEKGKSDLEAYVG